MIEKGFYQTVLQKKLDLDLDEIIEMIKEFVPHSCGPYLEKESFRLIENWRSVSIPLKNDFYLTLKGTEIEVSDIFFIYKKLMEKYFEMGQGSNSDHFYFKEGKLPMMMTNCEAAKEFRTSQMMARDFVTKFKKIPALPLPIATFTYVGATLPKGYKDLAAHLKSLYSLDFKKIQLGGIAYIYKGHPSRIKHWKQYCENPKKNMKTWIKGQETYFDSTKAYAQYVRLFAELTALGWILTPVGQEHLGYAVKSQNMTLVGGFVDVGNAYRPKGKLNRRDVISFLKSIEVLSESIKEISYPKNRISNSLASILFSNQLIQDIRIELKKIKVRSSLCEVFEQFYCNDFEGISNGLIKLISDDLDEDFQVII